MKKIFTILTMATIALGMISCGNSHEKTIANLKSAIDGETAASAKYTAFADRAEQEGLPEVAALFRATSQAEAIHIENHQKVLKALGVADYTAATPEFSVDSTLVNLQTALEGENAEALQMYPAFCSAAKEEQVPEAIDSFIFARDAEMSHANLYGQAIQNLSTPGAQAAAYFICPVCGKVFADSISEVCEICGTTQDKYIVIHAVVALEESPIEGAEAIAIEAPATK